MLIASFLSFFLTLSLSLQSYLQVLILDSFTRDVITPLLRLNDLRRSGVTLYLLIDSERQVVPDVPAIYFCKPSSSNVTRAIQDLATGTYDIAHLNFCLPLSDKYMQDLAAGLGKNGCMGRLAKLYDQNLAFVSLEDDLFSLMLPKSYVSLNDPSSKDSEIEQGELELTLYLPPTTQTFDGSSLCILARMF